MPSCSSIFTFSLTCCSSKLREAPAVLNATASEVAGMRQAVANTAKGYNNAKLRSDNREKELARWRDKYVSTHTNQAKLFSKQTVRDEYF